MVGFRNALRTVALITLTGTVGVSISATQSKPATTQPAATEPEISALGQFRAEAAALRSLVKSPLARQFLAAVDQLPTIAPRTIYRDKTTRKWMSEAQTAALTEEQRSNLEARPADDHLYYQTKYGTPLAYVRAFDLLGQNGMNDFAGARVLDFGYGTVGHMRMLASCGADTVGLDVDSFLTALYSEPSDTGVIKNPNGKDGRITLVDGRFNDDKVMAAVSNSYDLIISKNTLKRGYVNPAPPEGQSVDKRMLIDLGVNSDEFLQTLLDRLNPGGKLMIYNISPAQAAEGKPYLPMADGHCPWDRTTLERVGFRVVVFDQEDNQAARAMARALKWDQGERPMDLENDLFAWYTILERPAK